jgi:hypothetical protein
MMFSKNNIQDMEMGTDTATETDPDTNVDIDTDTLLGNLQKYRSIESVKL